MTYLLNWTNCLWNGLSWFDGNTTSYNTTTSGTCGSTTYNGNDCGFLSGGSYNTSLDVNFDSCLKDISFDLFDIDLSDCGPGKLCDIKFTDVLGNLVDAKYELINGVVKVVCDVPSTGFTLFNCSKDFNYDIKFGAISCSPAPEFNQDGEGVVEGTENADLIDYNYTGDPDGDKVDHNDALLQGEVGDDDIIVSGAGNDTIYAGAGNDEIYAGAGDDIATGGAGDDLIYGDSTLGNFATGAVETTGPRESFEWDKAPDPDLFDWNGIDEGDHIGSFSQNTGSVNVSFSKTAYSGSPETTYTEVSQLTSDIDDGAETIDSTSGLKSYLNANGESATYKLAFSNEVYNVDFRINDIDTDSTVRIRAFDADGNEVTVKFTAGSDISVSNADGLKGNDLLTSTNDADQSPTTASTSALVEIQGPVARIEILHSQAGSLGSGVIITDVYYDTGTPIAVDPATLVGGNDTLSGGLGDDTIFGEVGNDSISGGEGEDLLFGGSGSDSISGGDDNDTIYGDELSTMPSDGNFIVNGSFENVSGLTQTGYGYVGDGVIPGWTSTSTVNDMDIHNDGRDGIVATDGQNWLDLDASPGNIRVGQDIQGLTDGQTYELSFDVNDTPNKTSVDGPDENIVKVYWNGDLIATIDPYNANGDTNWDHHTFQLTAGSGDGTNRLEFQGAGSADNYGVALDNIKLVSLDGSLPAEDCGDDTIDGGAGDDLIYGNGGNDSIAGGLGNDTIYGDSGDGVNTTPVIESYVRESFEWNLADDPNGTNPIDNGDNLAGGFTQDTGRVNVTFEATTNNGTPVSTFANNQQKVHSVDSGSETIDPYSSLSSELDANGEKVTYSLDFSDEVRDVSFRVNDIDFNSKVVIKAYDANGNLVPIDVQAGANITVQDLDGVGGNETLISSQAMSGEDTDPNLSGLINIAGPIVRLEITHEQVGSHNSGINITDVYYDAPVYSDVPVEECEPGDDIIDGGEGSDLIFGNAGNDVITGGAGADTLYGGDDRDTFVGGTSGDVVDGGTDGDDFDVLDLRTAGAVRIVNQTTDADGDSTSGTVEFLDEFGNVVDTMEFTEIEQILLPENAAPDANPDVAETTEDTPISSINVLANDTDPNGDTLSIEGIPTALHGTVTVNPDGTINYTPDENYNGTDTITYTIRDEEGLTSTTTVSVSVTPVNDDPVANDDTASTDEETPVTIDVLANDTDVDGDDLTISEAPGEAPTAEHGTVEVVDGQLVYTPEEGYTGTDTITYTVSDGNGGTDTATVTVNVSNVNDAPVANPDEDETPEDTPVTIDVLANDTDEDGDALTISEAPGEAPTALNGTVTVVDGQLVYTPDENYNGTDTITYTIRDEEGLTSTTTVSVSVTPVNDDPVANDDTASTDEDMPVTIDVLGNDTDVDGDPLSVLGTPTAEHGTVEVLPNGELVYTPEEGYTGTDTITYTVSDGQGGTDTGSVTVSVADVNEVDAVDDTAETTEGAPVVINLTGNDVDPEGDNFTVTGFSIPGHGALSMGQNGQVTYTPEDGFVGTDSFTYTITDEHGATDTATVTVSVGVSPDQDPDAVDDAATTYQDKPVIIDVLGNDTDEDGDTLSVVPNSLSTPSHGTVVLNPDGTVTYTPEAGYAGTDTFTYTIVDEDGLTDTATVTVTVAPDTDPVAVDDQDTTYLEKPIVMDLVANDTDEDGDDLSIVPNSLSDPANGTVTLNPDGTVTYTPDTGFTGTDTFVYTITDEDGNTDTAQVTVDVLADTNPVAVDDVESTHQDQPVTIDVLGNDTDEDGDTLTVVPNSATDPAHGSVVIQPDGTIVYTPDTGYTGTDTFSYTVTDDDGNTDVAEVTVTIVPGTAPDAVDDDASTYPNRPVVIDVLGNDEDADGDTLSVVPNSLSEPEHGTVTLNPDGTVTYTPDEDYVGTDTFTYVVTDDDGSTDLATVTVTVQDNTAPDAVDDVRTVDQGNPITIDVLANDTDEDGDTLNILEGTVTEPLHGTVTVNPDGTIVYTPEPGYTGPDSFEYTIVDEEGLTDTATVSITVEDTNVAPDAVDDNSTTPMDEAVIIEVLANDTDPNSDPLSVVDVTDPVHGTVVINPDGTLTYTPDAGYTGTDTFDYTISDGLGGSDTATVNLTILAEPVPDGTVEGTAGDDLIDVAYTGDPDGDMIDNNDAILPGDVGDDDLVYGFDGDDTILAGQGDDEVYGGDGDDVIDTTSGELRPDLGYPGLWTADTDPLDDLDTVYGGDGNDTITTGDDDDSIDGGAGDDYIDAGVDKDTIDGGDGNDTIIGGEGDDIIDGGKGDDLIYGGLDGSFPDFINIPNADGDRVVNNGRDTIDAGEGNDTVYGEDDDDTIFGGLGNDFLDGGIDDDEIYGGDGTDTITGGEGGDDLFGGFGSDTFLGGTGGDVVVGGEDPDDKDIDVLDLRGSAVDFITYDQNDPEKGVVTFLDGSTMNFSEIENVIPCFTPGTTIATPQGERLVEELRVGDRVITRDNGIQEIAWVGQKELSLGQLEQSPHLKPVLIKAGSLGNGLPERDMIVSPNHRLLVASDLTQLYFEEREVLAAAKHLVGSQGIMNVEQPKTTYIHFMFERHEVVLSNGSWTESFQPGDYSLKGIGNGSREEIFELFPELRTREGIKDYNSARRALKRHEAKLLINK